jgi:hypothetical protein
MSNYSPGLPASFDPALLCSELEFLLDAPKSLSHSDDFEAFQQCIAEELSKKNTKGVVIQHRAWKLADVFRSEGEAFTGTTSAPTRSDGTDLHRYTSEASRAFHTYRHTYWLLIRHFFITASLYNAATFLARGIP